ncbi:HET-domain-containing protein [Stipitochalara longipes BDJ]|nr:HET-domain-containing protein [Stipitochalara longipes BDJ]
MGGCHSSVAEKSPLNAPEAIVPEAIVRSRPFGWNGAFLPLDPSIPDSMILEDSVNTGVLCPKCATIRLWAEQNLTTLEAATSPPPPQNFAHYEMARFLEESYREGCHLCALIWWNLNTKDLRGMSNAQLHEAGAVAVTYRFHEDKHTKGYQLECAVKYTQLRGPKVRLDLGLSDSPLMETIPKTLSEPGARLVEKTYNGLELKLFSSNVLPDQAAYCIYTKSSHAIHLARKWIKHCNDNHPQCAENIDAARVLPRRLLDIQSGSKKSPGFRLIETNSDTPNEPYIALSYCWGRSNVLKLTAATIDDLKAGVVPVSKLAKTIRDAIWLTRQLSVRYLWVDALCVMQDSKVDFAREVGAMRDVYRNCYLAIGASGASDCREGLFCQRDPLTYIPCPLYTDRDGSGVFVKPNEYNHHARSLFSDAPLYNRAWVVQERFLSPRTLNFGTTLAWECREIFQHDFETHGDEVDGSTPKGELHNFKLPSSGSNSDSSSPGSPTTLANDWEAFQGLWQQSVLSTYTKTKMTKASDRLPAITGLIKKLEVQTGWKNVLGLWEPFLELELRWTTYHYLGVVRRVSGCPTWSWGSIDGPVDYQLGSGDTGTTYKADVRGIVYPSIPSSLGEDPKNGHVMSEQQLEKTGVRVSGVVLPIIFRVLPHSIDGSAVNKPEAIYLGGPAPPPYYSFQYRRDVRDPSSQVRGPYLFLPLVEYEARPIPFTLSSLLVYGISESDYNIVARDQYCVYVLAKRCHGLVLTPSKKVEGAYERVGGLSLDIKGGHRIDYVSNVPVEVLIV